MISRFRDDGKLQLPLPRVLLEPTMDVVRDGRVVVTCTRVLGRATADDRAWVAADHLRRLGALLGSR